MSLGAFDRWEILEERPVRYHFMALPLFDSLAVAARVRLLQGLARGELRRAARAARPGGT